MMRNPAYGLDPGTLVWMRGADGDHWRKGKVITPGLNKRSRMVTRVWVYAFGVHEVEDHMNLTRRV